MKKAILAFILMSNIFAGNLTSEFESLLQENLSFPGKVEVTYIADAFGLHYQVYFNVTSYGETRPNDCEIKNGEILNCSEDWFSY
ncbi:MAG: hypothetical protein NXH75_13815 [Halobacteriovoraceae bacterium]|nr:hypothetical protein [Halobacteriovoraceae bacterium]